MKFDMSLNISWNEKVSSVLAILLLITLAFLIVIITLDRANEIKDDFARAQAVSVQKRVNQIEGTTDTGNSLLYPNVSSPTPAPSPTPTLSPSVQDQKTVR